MTGTNHVVTGALIGAIVSSPIIAVPLAIASHFLLDMLPHYGDRLVAKHSRGFHIFIIVDTVITISFLLVVLLLQPHHWQWMIVGGLMAMSPDLMWLPNYLRDVQNKAIKSYNKVMHWHENIQVEREWGIIVEAAWLLVVVPGCFWVFA